MKTRTFTIVLALVCSLTLWAQTPYQFVFQGELVNIPENVQSFNWNEMPSRSKVQNGYYGWVQFYQTPQQDVQDAFKANGLQLVEYIDAHTYLFYFPEQTSIGFLANKGVRGILPVQPQYKMELALKAGDVGDWVIDGNHYKLNLVFYPQFQSETVIADLRAEGASILQEYKGTTTLEISMPIAKLQNLAEKPYVKWVEQITAPSIKDDTRGRNLHRSNGLDTQTSAGRNFTGVGVGVMVRDDGIVGPHIDFQGRIDNSSASGTGQTHGDGVAGIMAGAGNLDPTMRGMAAGADVFIVNYVSSFLDSATLNLINNGDVQITNSSYSNGCNAGYTTVTRTVDQQTKDIPSLLHVFSGGNSNNNDCGYGAGTQWGNITGGHKQGKNVIATANVFFDGSLVSSSSRGPAHDGRIKPDIAANGQNQNSTDENNSYLVFGGTSGAAPGIAGVSAQLYELYAGLNGGNLPPSALIKAALLNTANEAGNIGPDFRFGWGIVNGLRAGKLIEDSRYLSNTVSQGNTETHTITIPAGVTQVRYMVYWSDPAASSGATTALVNDLDLTVTDPSNNTLMPWILDPTPNPTNLNTPATTGVDRLNNMEQVLINNPVAGNYTISVSGFDVPMGPQEYYVVYEIIEDPLTLTYPNDGESFVPGSQEVIHWDAVNTTDPFVLEYSTDNGGTWNSITTVSANTTLYNWTVPSTITGNAKIRVTSGAFSDVSDGSFDIASQASGFQFTQVCPDTASFSWNAVTDAESYDVYILGTQYMEVAGNSTTTTLSIPIANPNDPIWAAIVAKNDSEGWQSRRTIAINHTGGLLNCTLANDVALVKINNLASDFSGACGSPVSTISIDIQNTGVDPQSNFMVEYQISGQALVQELYSGTLTSGQQVTYEFTTPFTIPSNGNYTLTAQIVLAGDQNSSNDNETLAFYAQNEPSTIPFTEDFDTSGIPPNAWAIENPDDSFGWEGRQNITGSDGNPTDAPFINNFSYNAAGQIDYIISEVFDLSEENYSSATLNFDLAKAQYNANFSDALRVEISTDCGQNYTSIYFKDGLALSTLPGYNTSNWSPTSGADWRTESVDISSYIAPGVSAIIRFVNITGYGNGTFIDNVNIDALLGVNEVASNTLSLFPNPTKGLVTLQGIHTLTASKIEVYNHLGQMVYRPNIPTNTNRIEFSVAHLPTGLYFVRVKNNSSQQTFKLLVE